MGTYSTKQDSMRSSSRVRVAGCGLCEILRVGDCFVASFNCVPYFVIQLLLPRGRLFRSGIAAGLAELEQLKRLGRVKSLTRTFHCLLWNAVDHGKAEELAQVESVISSTSPTGLQRLKGFVLLELGKKGAFLDSLGQEPHLEHSQLLFMVEFAAKLKTVIVLESLLELSLVLQIRPQEKALIYDELIKIYGKHEDKDNLERITESILHESDRQPFTATLGRLAHFYRLGFLMNSFEFIP
ncbi:hypothetical protein TELCIR_07981 [Teladorsagia circumcincta]|uniref:Uncharacterized protein n=1 Tax=Teladorsagia circumcincta TaxID=45464 RepID=A0A2G9UIV2_TELCI|nr:hypothetical protein TELCIR_07981 [Teladorsagia circumcincta]